MGWFDDWDNVSIDFGGDFGVGNIAPVDKWGEKYISGWARAAGGWAHHIGKGDLNNIGATLQDSGAAMYGGDIWGGMSEESAVERAGREADAKYRGANEAAREAAGIEAAADKKRRINSAIDSAAGAKRSTPGASQTLLTQGYGGTLLTPRGS